MYSTLSKPSPPAPSVFVTVGTTSFAPLSDTIVQLLPLLERAGCRLVTLQRGRQSPPKQTGIPFPAPPKNKVHTSAPDSNSPTCRLVVHEYLDRTEMARHLTEATVVVAHAGAGTALEALRARPDPCLVLVANAALMRNHQADLLEALSPYAHTATDPSQLTVMLPNLLTSLPFSRTCKRRFPAPSRDAFPRLLEDVLA